MLMWRALLMTSSHASRYDPSDPSIPVMMRSDPNFITIPVEHTPSLLGIPTNAGLHEGNGGEYRKSFHGFASPVAYLVDSPTSVHVLPMQIDTWNRDAMNVTGSKFVPYLQPKHSLAPQGPDAMYSGLLECPLTDKVVKSSPDGMDYNDSYSTQIFQCPSNSSKKPLSDQKIAGYTEVDWPWYVHAFGPSSIWSSPAGTEELNLFWNPNAGGGDHWLTFGAGQAANATAAGYTLVRKVGLAPTAQSTASKKPVYLHYSPTRHDHFTSSGINPPVGYTFMGLQGYLLDTAAAGSVPMAWYTNPETGDGRWSNTRGDNVLAQDDGSIPQAKSCKHTVSTAADCFAGAKSNVNVPGNATVHTSQGASDAVPSGCTVTFDAAAGVVKAFFNTKESTQCCGAGVTELHGTAESLSMTLAMSVSSTTGRVQVTLTGPSTVWFGAGFFSQSMADLPYAMIVDGAGAVTERRMANHGAGNLLKPTVTVVSNTVAAGVRTVVLTRDAISHSAEYANFTMTDLEVPFINAVGSTSALSYHKEKTAATLSMWPSAGQPVCLCSLPAAPFGTATGTIKYLPTGESFGFTNYCQPEPRESVLAQRNPTCDVRSYVGGLQVCKHMWSLLDSKQENDARVQAWKALPLTYYQKYRIYFQDYVPQKHIGTIPRQGWGIAAAGGDAEYDVPQCPPGTPVEECTWEIWGVLTPGGNNLHLAAIHFHCHAPTCLEMAVYNNVTGALVCSEKPIYGGTDRLDATGARFDEPGYILQPPCLWGDAPGLEPMPLASGVKFLVKAITNSTYGHHGEMALPEVTLVPWTNSSSSSFAKQK